MSSPEALVNYIENAHRAGMTAEQIADALIGAGWRMADIVGLFLLERPAAPAVSAPQNFAIQAEGIKKTFGKVEALKEVSINVPYGKIVGLLGPNGAGKTTLVRILTTLLKPDAGRARVASYDVERQEDEVRSVVGLTGQFTAIDEYLTGRENLELVGKLYHLPREVIQTRTEELLAKFDLSEAARRQARTYSGGMKRRLDVAMGLFNRPKVLFLDEPTTGLDPQSRNTTWRIIKELVSEGTTVLLTTQYMEEADQLADRIVVLDHGRVIAEGTPRELKAQIGGDVLEVHAKSAADAERIAGLLRGLSHEAPHLDRELGAVSLPTQKGAAAVTEAVRLLDREGVAIADIALRRPTLDEVFLTLTGPK